MVWIWILLGYVCSVFLNWFFSRIAGVFYGGWNWYVLLYLGLSPITLLFGIGYWSFMLYCDKVTAQETMNNLSDLVSDEIAFYKTCCQYEIEEDSWVAIVAIVWKMCGTNDREVVSCKINEIIGDLISFGVLVKRKNGAYGIVENELEKFMEEEGF